MTEKYAAGPLITLDWSTPLQLAAKMRIGATNRAYKCRGVVTSAATAM